MEEKLALAEAEKGRTLFAMVLYQFAVNRTQ